MPTASALVVQLASKRRELRLLKASHGRRQKRLPPIHPPKSVALGYFHFLQDFLREATGRLNQHLLPLLRELAPARADAARRDAGKLPPKVKGVIQAAQEELLRDLEPPRLQAAIRQVGGSVSRAQRKDILYQLSSGLGFNPVLQEPELGPVMAKFTAENVSLIRTLPGSYFSDIEQTVAAGLDAGDTWVDIQDELVDRLGVAESRAKLIARDQVGKFYGKLNEARQTANGVTGYVWRTSEDNRVRDNHEHLDGTEQDWDDPPEGGGTNDDEPGHPGEGILCRCGAEPDLQQLLERL